MLCFKYIYVCLYVTLLRFDSFITTLLPFYGCTQPLYSDVCYSSAVRACVLRARRPGRSLRAAFSPPVNHHFHIGRLVEKLITIIIIPVA